MTFSLGLLQALIWGSVVLTAAGAVTLVTLLVLDFRGKSIW